MIRFYITKKGTPVKTNCPQPDWTEISEEEYIKIRDQKNKEVEEEQKQLDEQMKSIQKENELINERMKKIARDQLIEEGIING